MKYSFMVARGYKLFFKLNGISVVTQKKHFTYFADCTDEIICYSVHHPPLDMQCI
jgi:hypothetical protein